MLSSVIVKHSIAGQRGAAFIYVQPAARSVGLVIEDGIAGEDSRVRINVHTNTTIIVGGVGKHAVANEAGITPFTHM